VKLARQETKKQQLEDTRANANAMENKELNSDRQLASNASRFSFSFFLYSVPTH